MKQFWNLKSQLALLLAAAALVCSPGIGKAKRERTHSEKPSTTAKSAALPQPLRPETQDMLRATVDAGNLSDLRWPDFTDYTKHVQNFYASYNYSLPWVKDMQPTDQARQAIAVLQLADQKGLSAEDYDGPRWNDRLAKLKPTASQPSEADAAHFDLALTVCVMRYISDLHIGKVNPKHFDFGLDIEAKKYNLPDFLANNVVAALNVSDVLAQVEPPYPGYRRTIQALQTYLQLEKEPAPLPLPAIQKTIAPGDTYLNTPQLTTFLRLVGDLPTDANVPADAMVYQGPLVDAVKNFQRRFGRTPDGKITSQTIADINVPLTARVRQMQLTLERWRWLPVSYQHSPIVANIPEFRLRAYDENFKIALSMNVVVGKAFGHNTPIFSDTMQYVVFRPYWSVPYSIVRAEFLPHIAKDPDYLAKKGFEIVDARQEVINAGTVTPEQVGQLRAGKLYIRQTPGPKNSLGLVKFIFPNNYDIYFHDTPEQVFFSKSRRDFSHGCIRLERPADLALWVLRNNPGWDAERIHATMNGTTTQQVNLTHPIPVLIVYATVIVPENGQVNFYDDIYGHDATLEKVLDKGYPYPAN